MSNILDLQGLEVEILSEVYCPSSKSVIIVIPFS